MRHPCDRALASRQRSLQVLFAFEAHLGPPASRRHDLHHLDVVLDAPRRRPPRDSFSLLEAVEPQRLPDRRRERCRRRPPQSHRHPLEPHGEIGPPVLRHDPGRELEYRPFQHEQRIVRREGLSVGSLHVTFNDLDSELVALFENAGFRYDHGEE